MKSIYFLIVGLLIVSCSNQEEQDQYLIPKVNKSEWTVNETGILSFSITLNNTNLIPGDSISLGIPASWTVHMMHPVGDKPNQSYDIMTQEISDFIRIESEGNQRWEKSINRIGLDGSDHRFSRSANFKLTEGSVNQGDNVTIYYGSKENPINASFLAEKNVFPLKLFRGDSLIADLPTKMSVKTKSGPAVEFLVTLQSQGIIDQTVKLHITARDQYGNPAVLPGNLTLRSSDSDAVLPDYDVGSNDKFAEFDVQFGTTGFQKVEVGNNEFGFKQTNPIKVFEEEPEFKLLWGDLHSHSHMSRDGLGSHPFEYARDYANLDFYSLTDHASSDAGVAGVTDREWTYMQEQVESYYKPGEFTTLLAYEASFSHPYGHHNIYFSTDEAPLYREHEMETLPKLWQMLEDNEAFTVPHHTGIAFSEGGSGAAVDWSVQHPSEKPGHSHSNDEEISHSHAKTHSLRPLGEVYSAHGQSEFYDQNHPLSYDQFVLVQRWKEWFTIGHSTAPDAYRSMSLARSVKGPHYIRDGWAEGLRLGIIASSDDHTARPGQPHKGLAAAWASENNRDSVFNALLNKQTYGTTGQRIYLDFRANDNIQGQTLNNPKSIEFRIEVAGTDTLDWVELVQFDESTSVYETIREWNPDSEYATLSYSLDNQLQAGFYYVRLRQRKQVNARDVMAWSSPIWIE